MVRMTSTRPLRKSKRCSLTGHFDIAKSGETAFYAKVGEIFEMCHRRTTIPHRASLLQLFNALIGFL